MRLYKKNNKIYVDYLLGAKRIRKSLGLEWNKRNIQYAQIELIPKLLTRNEEIRNYLLSELFTIILERTKVYRKASTYYSYQEMIKTIFKFIKDDNVIRYTSKHIDDMVLQMYKQDYSSLCIRNYVGLLKQAFDIAIRMSVITNNPVFKIQIPNNLKRHRQIYSKDEISLLLKHSSEELQLYLYLAIYTGARPAEILALAANDIQDNIININKTLALSIKQVQIPKNGKSRQVFIPKEIIDYLQEAIKGKTILFSKCYTTIKRQFKALCEKLNLPYTGLHSLRHTYASILLNDKVNPLVIKESLGHADLSMLNKVYGHFTGYTVEDQTSIKNSLKF